MHYTSATVVPAGTAGALGGRSHCPNMIWYGTRWPHLSTYGGWVGWYRLRMLVMGPVCSASCRRCKCIYVYTCVYGVSGNAEAFNESCEHSTTLLSVHYAALTLHISTETLFKHRTTLPYL